VYENSIWIFSCVFWRVLVYDKMHFWSPCINFWNWSRQALEGSHKVKYGKYKVLNFYAFEIMKRQRHIRRHCIIFKLKQFIPEKTVLLGTFFIPKIVFFFWNKFSRYIMSLRLAYIFGIYVKTDFHAWQRFHMIYRSQSADWKSLGLWREETFLNASFLKICLF
jgi:hypothetical protein